MNINEYVVTTDHVTNTACKIIVFLYIFACSRLSIIERLQVRIFGTESGKNHNYNEKIQHMGF